MIRIGIGGWSFEPWRESFYPPDVPKSRELAYASSKLTSIEINSTFYGPQKPETFRKWASETPDDFIFSVKAPRVATNRKDLREAKDSVARFLEGGVTELGDKLGPFLWQLATTKKFDEAEMSDYLDFLPAKSGSLKLRHAVEAPHASFASEAFVTLARQKGVAIVHVEPNADSGKELPISDPTADFLYARLQDTHEDVPTGYPPEAIEAWADRLKVWESGGTPDDLPLIAAKPVKTKRDVFAYVISGAKIRAPAAAMALIKAAG